MTGVRGGIGKAKKRVRLVIPKTRKVEIRMRGGRM